jgi:hypothetical protein
MRELVEFEIDDDIAAEEAVVEDEIDEVVVFVEGEALLAGLEEKAFAEFEEEVFEAVDDSLFEIVFGVAGLVIEAEEFEDERLFQQVLWADDDLAFAGEFADAFFVAAKGEALVEAGGFLALEFWDGPAGVGGFDFVEAAFGGVFDGEEGDVMGPAEGEGRFARRRLANWLLPIAQQAAGEFLRRSIAQ